MLEDRVARCEIKLAESQVAKLGLKSGSLVQESEFYSFETEFLIRQRNENVGFNLSPQWETIKHLLTYWFIWLRIFLSTTLIKDLINVLQANKCIYNFNICLSLKIWCRYVDQPLWLKVDLVHRFHGRILCTVCCVLCAICVESRPGAPLPGVYIVYSVLCTMCNMCRK